MNKRMWNEEEDNYIKENFGKLTYKAMAEHIGCAIAQVQNRAEELGFTVTRTKVDRWTKEEEQLLIEYSQKYVTKTIAKKLGRSYIAVQKKAVKLGIELHSTNDPWKKWMVDYLKDNFGKKSMSKIQKELGLGYRQISKKCQELGLVADKKEKWSDEEVAILREYAPKCHYSELVKVLPGRSVGAIGAKAFELGIKTISTYTYLDEKQKECLKENWGVKTAAQIAQDLGVGVNVIYRYKKELNLPNLTNNNAQKWTDDVIAKLRAAAKTSTREELAKKFHTSVGQISRIAYINNIDLIDSRVFWTPEKLEILMDYIDTQTDIKIIAEKMNTSTSTIKNKLQKLGIDYKKDSKYWTDEEITLLEELAKTKTIEEIEELIPGKKRHQIMGKARKLGIKLQKKPSRKWTDDDTDRLIELSSNHSINEIAQILNYSYDEVCKKAKELNIAVKITYKKWTSEEIEQLKIESSTKTINELATLFARSTQSIGSKLRELGISAVKSPCLWSDDDIERLKTLAKEMSIQEIADTMNRSYATINYKLAKLGLKAVNRSNKKWSESDDEFLKANAYKYSTNELAKKLGRSEDAIGVRLRALGIYVNSHRPWTEAEDEILTNEWGSKSIETIAKNLNRTVSALLNRSYVLGLGRQDESNYDGLKVTELATILGVSPNIISNDWQALGLVISKRKISNFRSYNYIKLTNLWNFLEENQNMWDSRILEKNILGKEPKWLIEKRQNDQVLPEDYYKSVTLKKQQLLRAKKYYLELGKEQIEQNNQNDEEIKRSRQINDETN